MRGLQLFRCSGQRARTGGKAVDLQNVGEDRGVILNGHRTRRARRHRRPREKEDVGEGDARVAPARFERRTCQRRRRPASEHGAVTSRARLPIQRLAAGGLRVSEERRPCCWSAGRRLTGAYERRRADAGNDREDGRDAVDNDGVRVDHPGEHTPAGLPQCGLPGGIVVLGRAADARHIDVRRQPSPNSSSQRRQRAGADTCDAT